jgi:NADPH:quinone reductase-like Zn-dependent oxidoreductase
MVWDGPMQHVIKQLPVPTFEDDEVFIKIEAIGICGSDVHGFTGESGRRKPGMVMGHEIVGIVEKAPHHTCRLLLPLQYIEVVFFSLTLQQPSSGRQGRYGFRYRGPHHPIQRGPRDPSRRLGRRWVR